MVKGILIIIALLAVLIMLTVFVHLALVPLFKKGRNKKK